ncbi:MAG: hypothetical protein JWM86_914 [Thermoleophilia bacterium]|nr:hypothetical protein [Thermoleophilia bacterium]
MATAQTDMTPKYLAQAAGVLVGFVPRGLDVLLPAARLRLAPNRH